MTLPFDPKKVAEEVEWLKKHPHFEQKPASISEFLGEGYLELGDSVRPGLRKALVDIFGEEVNGYRISKYERAMLTGAIGIGKTTFSSIAIPYMAHWILCLKNPQEYFGLMPGSRIAFMQMSTSAKQVLEVVFGDIMARIENSPWFINNYPKDPDFTKQIRFPKEIWIIPGGSGETQFEGYNILGGILDEMDSHKITENKDYADVGFDAIENRISSRFTDFGDEGEDMGHKGLIICIGQMKKSVGFAARKYKAFKKDPKAYVMRMTIWESFGWHKFTGKDGVRRSFWYDTDSKKIVPTGVIGLIKNDNLLEIPNAYRTQFETNPEKALRDLAGIPPMVGSAFMSNVVAIKHCRDKWIERFDQSSPVKPNQNEVLFEEWFKANGDHRKRTIHIDFGLTQDALGMALAHIDHMEPNDDGELQPYIIFDALMRIKARPGQQILYAEMRRVIYYLKETLGFKIKSVTKDGFQSVETEQALRKKKYNVYDLSMDKSTQPYEDLREAIYENRVEFPQYITYVNNGDTETVEIAVQELSTLIHAKQKIDHPPDGSKDVADAMAGCVYTLMGDRSYRRSVGSGSKTDPNSMDLNTLLTGTDGSPSMGSVLSFPGMSAGLKAPVPPSTGSGMGLTLPTRLQPRGR
jgi:hypothetical protein